MAASLTAYALPLLALLGSVHGACENPASFKKCVAQTRAEVNICGINMTCKCVRQENVVHCYDKCGDDSHYRKLQEGEKGQQQIFCSQRRKGEPEELPIIGSDGQGESEQKPAKKPAGKPQPQPQPQQPPQPPAGRRERPDDGGLRGGRGDRGDRGAGGGSVLRNFDIDGAPAQSAAQSLAAAILAVCIAALV
ncbi:hypothetical protein LPJ53_003901 [Coemansia erecta]|uniref:Extracellular membrane protein CFEM domain-containing protein n=1 Tax=Coemansia erecta TaxID=147472 RepID=A0A9W7Y115_9FUNG|nr:hypothetical protein LPJ53_003901 [Coemansia erecta]